MLSASSVRAQVVYSGRVYTARGYSWHQLRAIQLSDGKTTALTNSPRSHDWPRCSLDGRYIYFLSSSEDDDETFPQEIWRLDRSTGAESLVFQQPNLLSTTDPDYYERAIWGLIGTSADGEPSFSTSALARYSSSREPKPGWRLPKKRRSRFSRRKPAALRLIGQDGHLRVIDTSGRLVKDLRPMRFTRVVKRRETAGLLHQRQIGPLLLISRAGTTEQQDCTAPGRNPLEFSHDHQTWRPDGRSLLVGCDGAESGHLLRDTMTTRCSIFEKHTWKYIDGWKFGTLDAGRFTDHLHVRSRPAPHSGREIEIIGRDTSKSG